MAYRQLGDDKRNLWLRALDDDAKAVAVPAIALYAPLLAVETDKARRALIEERLSHCTTDGLPKTEARALVSGDALSFRVVTIVTPLYLNFVQVIACAIRNGDHFEWVKHDPVMLDDRAPRSGDRIEGLPSEAMPLKAAVDVLAHAVVSHQRTGRELPEALRFFADLFHSHGDPYAPR